MTDWVDLTNFGIVCAGLIVAIIGLILTMASSYMEKISRKFFMIFFPMLIELFKSPEVNPEADESISEKSISDKLNFAIIELLAIKSFISAPC